MLDLDAVIVDYHCSQLVECISSLETLGVRRAVVVDNGGSTDWTLLHQAADQARISIEAIHFAGNRGFGAGCNVGVAKACANHVLLLNPDAIILAAEPKSLARALAGPRTCILGFNVIDENGEIERSSGRLPTMRDIMMSGLLRRGETFKDALSLDPDQELPAGWVSGAAMVIPRREFVECGGFDERIFMYYEDVELCKRMSLLGAAVCRHGAVTVRHSRGGTPASEFRRKVWQIHSLSKILR